MTASSTVTAELLVDAISIPPPVKCEYMGGVMSVNHGGKFVSLRMHSDDIALLTVEALELGISNSALIRWCTVYVLQELHRRRTGVVKQVRP